MGFTPAQGSLTHYNKSLRGFYAVHCSEIAAHVRFGSLADMCVAKRRVRFTPNSDRESGHP